MNDVVADADLYRRGSATLVASWTAYADGATGASLQRLPGVAAAVFPRDPERSVYNNALLDRGLTGDQRAGAIPAMEAVYAAAGVARFAAWVHESDTDMRNDLERRGYAVEETTRAMGMHLDDLRPVPAEIRFGPAHWSEYLTFEGLPPNFLPGADHAAFHVQVARIDGEIVAAALAYDFDGDCGIYNVGTAEHARRRGLGTALTMHQVHEGRKRGCTTATLQSTPMAERVYAAAGFRDLGRILEYTRR
ncbi:GNAT family N-acetyltransferase [Actinoplanes sp. NPDC051633]|uniref:GNAT family N-acetyltransferase n=1 Tax=Actinoplanes sp. NPDC051633 TaxID=3155670 RepID=UPI003447780C